jgi:tight adherence protein B
MFPLVIAGLLTAALLGFAVSVLLIGGDDRSGLEKRLSGFGGGADDPGAAGGGASDAGSRSDQALAETRLMQEMVGFTGRLAERVGLLNRVEAKLEQADLPLRPPEALFFHIAGVFVVLLGALLLLPIPAALLFAFLAAVVPVLWLERRRKKRVRAFENQLPDVLNLLAGTMRAGFSFAQGLEAVAEEAAEPSRRELQRVFAESRLGRPIEDALEDSANRMHSTDMLWSVMAIRIQREVGGNLAELLDMVARTMTERERMKREILALTAEGRMSAMILGVFPPGFGIVLYLVQPTYMQTLLDSTKGVIGLGLSGVMALVGFMWLSRIMRIEV